ncbi:aprataxin and PNK-like factor isoform X2 [Loxodonta africana]|uniref:aprataxin and PNK-like factor isoform X2 n=1 Tax=Loxodonta africana TaxID=9785 RepID=UPI0002234B4D|nr:aprataxin and PNK-like factor [Loxodonta africana]
MSGGFELQPLDGGPGMALAPGETVIGRGALLGITDKRVSRRHAILEVVGGQLRIKPIHTNPCFYQSFGKSQLLPLKINLWHWLNPGDCFSLLVDKYIFRVSSTRSEREMECTLRNSQMLEEDNVLDETSKTPLIHLPDGKSSAPQLEKSTEIANTPTMTTKSRSVVEESGDFSKQQPNLAQRKRILPAWMLKENLSDQTLSTPVNSGGNGVIQEYEKEEICKGKTQVSVTQQGRKRLISSRNSESTSAEQDPGKKCKNVDQEESSISSKETPQSFSAVALSSTEVSDVKTDTQREELPIQKLDKISEQRIITKRTPNKKDQAASSSESSLSAPGNSCRVEVPGSHPESGSDPSSPETSHAEVTVSVPQGSEEDKAKRTSCMYGANCYRKNPVHFQHFSHPGDSDYGGVQGMYQDEADDRPECPYGASCYRKNPQHKTEYKHSTPPVRSNLDEDDDDVGQPNEYDLNDSFIDDEEEEEYQPTDEDSDWEPGKEDQDKEDVEELLKEAKKFIKRKK